MTSASDKDPNASVEEAAMAAPVEVEKRNFLKGVSIAAVAGSLMDSSTFADARAKEKRSEKEAEVTPPEDLMREHGVLDRLLLIYEAGLRKFDVKEDFDPALLTGAAQIVRDFIENYHEESEEQAVFPRFKKAGKLVPLVDTLLVQHKAGRKVTETILQSAPGSRHDGDDRRRLVPAIQSFIAMYRPHAAREDTELFPLLRGIVSAHEYDAMAEDFERKEHQKFGGDGFEMMVHRVAGLEQTIGINDLAQFTPK
jgi:hemerythrin-like domain-containing protein